MRGLTLRQPWAYAVTHLGKRVENRPTRPPRTLIGKRFAVHAAKKVDAAVELAEIAQMRDLGLWTQPLAGQMGRAPRGAIVATAKMLGYIAISRISGMSAHLDADLSATETDAFERAAASRWFTGPIGIVLVDVVVLPRPVPARGMQGYWPVTDADAVDVVTQEILGRAATAESAPVAKTLAAWAGEYPGAHA